MAKKRRTETLVEEAPAEKRARREEIPEADLFRTGSAWYVVHTYSG